ncbi:hypothetical protein [Dethiosulfovibrio salsuginis]|nr:hypothetical protein [Dethiosulfovibrio salsuginis]
MNRKPLMQKANDQREISTGWKGSWALHGGIRSGELVPKGGLRPS